MIQDKKDRTAGRMQDRREETRQVVGQAGQAGGYRTYIDRGYSYTMHVPCIWQRSGVRYSVHVCVFSICEGVREGGYAYVCGPANRPRTLP